MEQRTYHGSVSPDELADYLIGFFDPVHDLQAQKLGSVNSLVVQIAHGDAPEERRHAVTVGIVRSSEDDKDLVVTVGQQEWITPKHVGYTAMVGLITALVTPWAVFGLIWPLTEIIKGSKLPHDVWHAIDAYVIGTGATVKKTEILSHPHVSQ